MCKCCACPIPLLSAALTLVREKNSRVRPCELEHFHPQDSPYILLTILADHATGFTVPSRCLHFFCFFDFCWFMRRASPYSNSHFLLMRDAMSELRNTDAGNVGVAEIEEIVDKPGTTIGTWFSVLHFIRLPSLMSCGFLPVVHS